MLTRLRFKNWRSLRDVEIADLTPLTVFIGANASGKTNIVDALAFLRRLMVEPNREAVFFWGNSRRPIRTLGVVSEPIELELEYSRVTDKANIAYMLRVYPDVPSEMDETFSIRDGNRLNKVGSGRNGEGEFGEPFSLSGSASERLRPILRLLIPLKEEQRADYPFGFPSLGQFILYHWQILSEHGASPEISNIEPSTDYFSVREDGSNTLDVLNFMQQNRPAIFAELMNDFRWLLSHVEDASIVFDGRETRLTVKEHPLSGQDAPTISGGTLRLLAMLTAYYALDMQLPELPGLVVIEEPDTGLNPDLLDKFVEQLRSYTERADRPRQFILTTHNPAFLNYFKPEEVRIVERDETGNTSVHGIPPSVYKTLIGKYPLGEIWQMRVLGGVPHEP